MAVKPLTRINGRDTAQTISTGLGLVVQTVADTYVGRSLVAGTGIAITNGDGISSNPTVAQFNIFGEVSSTANATTSTSTDATLTGITTSLAAGTYQMWFSGTATSDTAGAAISASLYVNSAQQAATIMKISPLDGGLGSSGSARGSISINKQVILASTQTVEVRWSISSGNGTFGPRVMNWFRIA